MEERIGALPALSLEQFQQRKKARKKRTSDGAASDHDRMRSHDHLPKVSRKHRFVHSQSMKVTTFNNDLQKSSHTGYMKPGEAMTIHGVFNETNNNDPMSVPSKRFHDGDSKEMVGSPSEKLLFKKKMKNDAAFSKSSDLWNTEMRLFDGNLKRKSGIKKMKTYAGNETSVIRLSSKDRNNSTSLAVTVTCSSSCDTISHSAPAKANNKTSKCSGK